MITRKDVAELAGVSKTTVTRVLSGRGYVSEENRKKVKAAVEKLNYIPNMIAKNLNQKFSNIVAVLVEDLTNQYYLQIISAMNSEAMRAGMMVSLFSVNKNNINSVIENLIANRVRGIVNLALYTCDKRYIDILKNLGIFLINIEGGNALILNYESGIIEVFERLRQCGKKRVAFLAGLSKDFIANDNRYLSYNKCVDAFGFVRDDGYVIYGNYPEEDAFSVGRKSVRELLAAGKSVDCVLCLNDVVAIGALHELWKQGVRIPDDVSVVGCDNILMSSYTTPPLASFDIGIEQQAHAFIESMLSPEKQQDYVFNARLVVRESLI